MSIKIEQKTKNKTLFKVHLTGRFCKLWISSHLTPSHPIASQTAPLNNQTNEKYAASHHTIHRRVILTLPYLRRGVSSYSSFPPYCSSQNDMNQSTNK